MAGTSSSLKRNRDDNDEDSDGIMVEMGPNYIVHRAAIANNGAALATGRQVDAICLGTGRFLRSVLVPALLQAGLGPPILVHPLRDTSKKSSFLEYLQQQQEDQDNQTPSSQPPLSYPVDTVHSNGALETQHYPVAAVYACTAGNKDDGDDASSWSFWRDDLPKFASTVSIVGVGVTEAGLAQWDTPAMACLYRILCTLLQDNDSSSILVVNTDNVPGNGDRMRDFMLEWAKQQPNNNNTNINVVVDAIRNERLQFANSMVDCIVSHRNDNEMVPRAEPWPRKTLVMHVPSSSSTTNSSIPPALASWQRGEVQGLWVRSTAEQLEQDVHDKLTICNATHTAMAHALALSRITKTSDDLRPRSNSGGTPNIWMGLLENLVRNDILLGDNNDDTVPNDGNHTNTNRYAQRLDVWEDWKGRLLHPHFGLSTFFITQNGVDKLRLRLGPTLRSILHTMDADSGTTTTTTTTDNDNEKQHRRLREPSVCLAWAYANVLRWLTPGTRRKGGLTTTTVAANDRGFYTGWLDMDDDYHGANRNNNKSPDEENASPSSTVVEYANGMRYDLVQGWYEFQCPLVLEIGSQKATLAEHLGSLLCSSSTPLSSGSSQEQYNGVILAYLQHEQASAADTLNGRQQEALSNFAMSVTELYSRMLTQSVRAVLEQLDDTSLGLKATCSSAL